MPTINRLSDLKTYRDLYPMLEFNNFLNIEE